MDFDEIISFENLYQALQKCKNGSIWKDSVARYWADGLKETYQLHEDLKNGTYILRPYVKFTVTDPKRRDVMATHIRDRQFQRSLCDNGLYDCLTRSFIRDNYACQKGRGLDDALNRMDAHLHRFYRKHGLDGYVLKCDIRHYFASTRHDVVKKVLQKRIQDARVLKAVEQIVDSFGDGIGIGLGSQVSQLIQLAVLDEMDHFIKERLHIKHYLRYMDDFVLIHEDKEYLKYCRAEIEKSLSELGLELNHKTQLFPLKQGIIWLKWKYRISETGKVTKSIGKTSVKRERKKLSHMKRNVEIGKMPMTVPEQSLQSWISNAKRGSFQHPIDQMKRYYQMLFSNDETQRGLDSVSDPRLSIG